MFVYYMSNGEGISFMLAIYYSYKKLWSSSLFPPVSLLDKINVYSIVAFNLCASRPDLRSEIRKQAINGEFLWKLACNKKENVLNSMRSLRFEFVMTCTLIVLCAAVDAHENVFYLSNRLSWSTFVQNRNFRRDGIWSFNVINMHLQRTR